MITALYTNPALYCPPVLNPSATSTVQNVTLPLALLVVTSFKTHFDQTFQSIC